MEKFNCIVVLGTTASGKTRLACGLAAHLNGEIISADSRQVYRGLNIGTGKDLEEYVVNGIKIGYHLIDIADPKEQFYLHQFMFGLRIAFDKITADGKLPIICGGTGLYLDALRKDLNLTGIAENSELRIRLETFSKEELIKKLNEFPVDLINAVDLSSKKRIIRGIEIAEFRIKNDESLEVSELPYSPYYIGIKIEREENKRLITERLTKRLKDGLIDEARELLKQEVSHERLERLGLEYKFVSRYLQKLISREELYTGLQTAIFQFAKRQMTWYRKMEKEGVQIHWVGRDSDLEKISSDLQLVLNS